MKAQLLKLLEHNDLNHDDITQAMDRLIDSNHREQAAAFISLLSAKGIRSSELVAIVNYLKKQMLTIKTNQPCLDIVGTGGDGANTINISTPAAILAAACGANVIKHGNRSSSSLCGSSDVLEQLGYNLHQSRQQLQNQFETLHFAYCFAPQFHPTLSKVKALRKALDIPTVFNLVGPLLNPANCQQLMIGVYKPELIDLFTETIISLGIEQAMVFHGNGTDELTTCGTTEVMIINNNSSKKMNLSPKQFGFKRGAISDIKGGNAAFNAKKITQAFKGEPSTLSDTLALNAGSALYLQQVTPSIEAGIDAAQDTLSSGRAYTFLNRIIEASHG